MPSTSRSTSSIGSGSMGGSVGSAARMSPGAELDITGRVPARVW